MRSLVDKVRVVSELVFGPVCFAQPGMRGGKIRVFLERATEHRNRIFEVLHFVEILQVAAALQIKSVCRRGLGAMRGKRLFLLRLQRQLATPPNALRDLSLQSNPIASRGGGRPPVHSPARSR